MSEKIKLFLVDDHQMLIDGIKALLKNEKAFEIIGESVNPVSALEQMKKNTPHIVLSDISMPQLSGIEFTKELKKKFPGVKVLALSMFGDRAMISEMLDAGADGYILKNTGKKELVDALTKIASGGMYFSDEVSAEMMKAISAKEKKEHEPAVHLTEREIEIVRLIAKEYSNAQIAEELFISERTVETHRKNIFRKTATKGVVGLLKFAMEQKIV